MVLYKDKARRRRHIVGAIVLVAAVVCLEAYSQFRDIAACVERGAPRPLCADEHRNLVRVISMGLIALVLVSPPLIPERVQRAADRLLARIARPPEDDESRRKLEMAGHISVPSVVVAVVTLPLWLVSKDASQEVWATIFFGLFTLSATLFVSGVVFSIMILRRSARETWSQKRPESTSEDGAATRRKTEG